MNPAEIVLAHTWSALPHHATLSVLDVALQAAVQVLRHAHPALDDHEPAAPSVAMPADFALAEIIVTSALALLQTLRHYRNVQQDGITF